MGGNGQYDHVEHSNSIRTLSYGCLLLFWIFELFALSGIQNAEHPPRRKRFGAVYRYRPWPAFTALFFLVAGTICQILYLV